MPTRPSVARLTRRAIMSRQVQQPARSRRRRRVPNKEDKRSSNWLQSSRSRFRKSLSSSMRHRFRLTSNRLPGTKFSRLAAAPLLVKTQKYKAKMLRINKKGRRARRPRNDQL